MVLNFEQDEMEKKFQSVVEEAKDDIFHFISDVIVPKYDLSFYGVVELFKYCMIMGVLYDNRAEGLDAKLRLWNGYCSSGAKMLHRHYMDDLI